MAVKSISIPIKEEVMKEIGYAAVYEGRSVNSHILFVLRGTIKAFETAHGKIKGDLDPAVSVNPAWKP